jgi:glutathione S-transferase
VQEEVKREIMKYSPTGKVPALIDDNIGVTVVESLAINFYLAERYPDAGLLPSDPVARALCISAATEMHAGFMALRHNCPHHCTAISSQQGEHAFAKPDVQQDMERLQTLWEGLLSRFGTGNKDSFLFGANPTIADIMYAPVAIRFKGYDPHRRHLSTKSWEYVDTLLNMEGVKEWIEDAKKEGPEMDLPQYEKYHDK